MKKIIVIAAIIALVAVVFCFSACSGTGEISEEMTSAENEITSMIEEGSSAIEDFTDNIFEEETTTQEDTTTTESLIGEETTAEGEE